VKRTSRRAVFPSRVVARLIRSENHPRATHAATHGHMTCVGNKDGGVGCDLMHRFFSWAKAISALFLTDNAYASSATHRSGIGTVLLVAAASKGLSLHRSG